ncbi:site-specific integrase [Luteimonas sp. A478]
MIESEMARGVWLSRSEAESTTLLELLDRYEKEVVPAKKGRVQEISVLGAWRETDLAKRTVAHIRGVDLAQLRDHWLRSYEPATVVRRLSVLSHLFNVARREWGMESLANPVSLIRKPTLNNSRTRRIAAIAARDGNGDATELDMVVAATGSRVLPAIIRLAVESAMRRGEIMSLCWEHIDLERQVAHLPNTKNGSARDVPLSKAAVAVLAELKQRHGDPATPGALRGPVFTIRGDAVTRAFERAVARARQTYEADCIESDRKPDPHFLTDLCFHDLRHEATSRMAAVYQLHELAKVTGHKDPRMLMRYYHPRAEDLAKKLG